MSEAKVLYLVRHAKSGWEHPGLADRERPLNRRGELDAPRMGRRMTEREARPELIVSSPAVRALTTAQTIAGELGFPPGDVVVDERIYGAGAAELLEVIREFDDRFGCAMLTGHNPDLTDLVYKLTRTDLLNVPTCGVVCVGFETETWSDVGGATARLLDFDYPKKSEQ
jgi:phosphohistidine phosphatase